MNIDMMKQTIDTIVSEHLPACIFLNDDFADHPEISEHEFETSRKIVDYLKMNGYDVQYPAFNLDTSFFATYGANNHTHKVALLVEYDALPEVGHACGHCASGMMSVLASLSLKDLQDALDTDIHLIGTPAEETIGAKCYMVDDGVFDPYDFAIMIHLFNKNLVRINTLAMNAHNFTFYGKESHAAAAPWEGLNALNAVMLMFHGIDMLRQHVTPDVRMHGVISHGGVVPNIVPEKATANFYIRAEDRAYLNELLKKVDKIAEGAALMTGTTFEKETPEHPFDNLKRNDTAEAALLESFSLIGEEVDDAGTLGSSDVGNVSYRCPAVQPTLKLADEEELHTLEFAALMKTGRVHEGIGKGAKLIAYTVVNLFSDKEKIEKLHEDFNKKPEIPGLTL